MFFRQSSEVNDGIAHTTEGGVDADTCTFGDFLEIHLAVVTHDDHATLLGGKHLDQLADIGACLFLHDLLLDVVVVDFQGLNHVAVGTVGDKRHLAQTAEIVDDEVVGNTHNPMDEFVLILVVTRIDGVYHFVKGILKDIVGDIFVLDYREDVAGDFVLVP